MKMYDVTDLESAFRDFVIDGGVTTTVYDARPKAAVPQNDFAVVRMTGRLEDMATYGECEMGVHLFAKDLQAFKNSEKLKWMQTRLMAAVPAETEDYVIDIHPFVLPDVADDYGFHARIITFSVTVKNR
jgi:hypothetical protein